MAKRNGGKDRLIHIARIAPPPTPPPPTPQPTPAPRSSIHPPPVVPVNGNGRHVTTNVVAPIRQQTAPPRPSPTPLATTMPTLGPCGGHENAPAAVASTPDVGDIPPQARASKASGIAQIHVLLDAQARITDTSIAQSSGNSGLDAVAVQLARDATYSPKYVACKAVPGDVVFSVHFSAL